MSIFYRAFGWLAGLALALVVGSRLGADFVESVLLGFSLASFGVILGAVADRTGS